jgi:hypothetical protein
MIIKKKRTEGKIKADYGIKDYYKYFTENNPELKIDYKTYKSVVSEFNKEIIELIVEKNVEYNIPYLGSSISIKKDKRIPRIVNGKLYNTAPVDWVATNKLWSEDAEAMEKKLLVRYLNSHTSKYVFRIYFKKFNLYFANKKLFSFQSNRDFKRFLGARIKDENKDKYESYLLY